MIPLSVLLFFTLPRDCTVKAQEDWKFAQKLCLHFFQSNTKHCFGPPGTGLQETTVLIWALPILNRKVNRDHWQTASFYTVTMGLNASLLFFFLQLMLFCQYEVTGKTSISPWRTKNQAQRRRGNSRETLSEHHWLSLPWSVSLKWIQRICFTRRASRVGHLIFPRFTLVWRLPFYHTRMN